MVFLDLLNHYSWVPFLLLPFAGAAAVHILARISFKVFKNRIHEDHVIIRAAIDSLANPFIFYVWFEALRLSYCLIQARCPIPGDPYAIRKIATLLALSWFFLSLTKNLKHALIEKWKRKKKSYDLTTVDAFGQLANIAVVILISIMIFQNLGINLSGILAFGGIGGLAISFAAKDLLANLFGALSIHWDRPFRVGDWIRSPDKEIEGFVEHIGWRLTRIRTFEKRPLYVPNALFTTISIENPSRMRNRRFKEIFSLRYEDIDKIPEIIEKFEAYLKNSPSIDATQVCFANLEKMNDYSLDILVCAFTKATLSIDYQHVRTILHMDLFKIVIECGADFAFPTNTILMSK